MQILARPSRLCQVAFVIGIYLLCSPSSALAAFTNQSVSWLNGFSVNGYSASLADIDNDGDLDLLFQGSGAQSLLRNDTINVGGTASQTFTNVTTTMWQPSPVSSTWSAAWSDFDGDGLVDVLIGENNSGNPNGRLMRNIGGSFVDVSLSTGLNYTGFAQNVAWVDMNNDRRLDMVIGMENGQVNQIYLQDSLHHFTPVAPANGISNPVSGRSYGMAIGDADGDGDLDIYISPCLGDGAPGTPKAYYKNNLIGTGGGTTLSFSDVSYTNGTQNISPGYGAEFVDFDNDGKLDLYVTGANQALTKIYKNVGGGQFVDVDTITGHAVLSVYNPANPRDTGNNTDLNGAKAIDYDNDGDLDLFFHDNLNPNRNVKLYRNDSNPNAANPADRWKFTDVTWPTAIPDNVGITDTGLNGYDSVWGDIDLDGG